MDIAYKNMQKTNKNILKTYLRGTKKMSMRIYVETESDRVKVEGWAAVKATCAAVVVAAIVVISFVGLVTKCDLDLTTSAEAQEVSVR